MPKLLDPKQIEKDIEEVKKTLNHPKTPEDVKKQLQESLEIMEHDLARAIKSQQKRELNKAERNKKQKEKKSPLMFGGKNLSDATVDELMDAFQARLSKSQQNPAIKTTSIITKTSNALINVATQAVQKVVEAGATGNEASQVVAKISDVIEDALNKIRIIIKPHLENADITVSEQAKKDLEAFENLANQLKNKY